MSEEEKKAIEVVEFLIDRFKNIEELKHDSKAMQTVLNIITKKQKEIENKDKIIGLMVKEIFYKLSQFEYGYSEGEVKEYFRKKCEE